MDFRSPMRQLPGIQDGFNRKGLISDQGQKKQAFFVLQSTYKEWEAELSKKHPYTDGGHGDMGMVR
jgi:hypothetical protein